MIEIRNSCDEVIRVKVAKGGMLLILPHTTRSLADHVVEQKYLGEILKSGLKGCYVRKDKSEWISFTDSVKPEPVKERNRNKEYTSGKHRKNKQESKEETNEL